MINPEQKLWRAVLWQAIYDAYSISCKVNDKKEALRWLKEDSKNLRFVCDLADISVETIQKFISRPDIKDKIAYLSKKYRNEKAKENLKCRII